MSIILYLAFAYSDKLEVHGPCTSIDDTAFHCMAAVVQKSRKCRKSLENVEKLSTNLGKVNFPPKNLTPIHENSVLIP